MIDMSKVLLQYWDREQGKAVTITPDTPLPIAGVAGGGGVNFLSGPGDPTIDVGQSGDVYLNTTNGDLFNKNDEWELLMNLMGPQGPGGAEGPEGKQGPAGADGFPTEEMWNDLVARVESIEGEE